MSRPVRARDATFSGDLPWVPVPSGFVGRAGSSVPFLVSCRRGSLRCFLLRSASNRFNPRQLVDTSLSVSVPNASKNHHEPIFGCIEPCRMTEGAGRCHPKLVALEKAGKSQRTQAASAWAEAPYAVCGARVAGPKGGGSVLRRR